MHDIEIYTGRRFVHLLHMLLIYCTLISYPITMQGKHTAFLEFIYKTICTFHQYILE